MAHLYFAYGSNMSLRQMQRRCPESTRLGIGHLPGHRLAFPRFSKNRQCGVAGIEAHADSAVWGVIYELSAADWDCLDRFEGYQPDRHPDLNNYNRLSMTIHVEGPQLGAKTCMTYVATRQGIHFPPDDNYHRLIIDGARESGLPPDYVEWLECIAVMTKGRGFIM